MSAKNEHGLTPQQEDFAKAVVSGLSLSAAYRKAYPASERWKEDSVHNKASAMSRKAQVKARVRVLAQAVDAEFTISTADLLRESARIAFSDVRNITTKGKALLPHELDTNTGRAISSFKIDEYGRIEYKFWDKNSALERLFKHKGLFEVDNSQKTANAAAFLKSITGDIAGPGGLSIPEDDHGDD